MSATFSPTMSKCRFLAFSFTAFMSGLKELYPFYDKQDKTDMYWTNNSPSKAIENADQYFEQRKFRDAYELLNRPKFNSSSEVQWRIGRILYKLSTTESVTKKVQRGMIEEASYVLNASLKQGEPVYFIYLPTYYFGITNVD